jgi:dienelactone hydrolase
MRRPFVRAVVVLGIALTVALLGEPVGAHVRAASLLLRFADEHAEGGLAGFHKQPVDEEATRIVTSSGDATRGRFYVPRGAAHAPGVVLVHGVHRLGIDEPRLVRFARAVASTGVVVLTPEVKEIADYRIDPRSIETIGAAARALAARTERRAGIMGMSFAGGLSLLAAADPRFASSVGFVVAIGAHDDLARVSRFFATDEAPAPDGRVVHLKAHGYGALVLVYQRAERFFPPEDVEVARDAIRLWLWDDRAAARARAEALSPLSWARIDALFEDPAEASAAMLDVIGQDAEGMASVSPHGRLGALTAPTFLLHGAGDTVIPAVETEWLARDVPPAALRDVLVSPALVHVELGPETPMSQKWDLVHFMARVLEQADAS